MLRYVAIAFALGATLAFTPLAQAQKKDSYPDRPIRMVIGYPAGGTIDTVGRLLAESVKGDLGQPLVVDNRAGAGGLLGAQTVASSAPDGYTVLMAIGSHTILPSVQKKMPYDTMGDFAPLALVGTSPNMILVRKDHPANTLAELIRMAKAAPGSIDYATPGIGTTTHVTAAMLESAAGIKLNHIPYKGSAESVQAVVAGQVPVVFASIVSAGQPVRDGRLKALAIVGASRSPLLPQVPTFDEQGVKGVLGDNWMGLLAPARTPSAVLHKLETVVQDALQRDEFKAALQRQGVAPQAKSSTEFKRLIAAELAAYAELAKTTKLTTE